eukprot:1159997-Pelagomonas_calceolata.AAC.2
MGHSDTDLAMGHLDTVLVLGHSDTVLVLGHSDAVLAMGHSDTVMVLHRFLSLTRGRRPSPALHRSAPFVRQDLPKFNCLQGPSKPKQEQQGCGKGPQVKPSSRALLVSQDSSIVVAKGCRSSLQALNAFFQPRLVRDQLSIGIFKCLKRTASREK